jgi:rhamnulokinase
VNPRHYRDRRTRGAPEQVFHIILREEIFERTGTQFLDFNSLYQLYALCRDSPEVLKLASKLLFMPDLFNYFLTGIFACEKTIASTSQFYDPVKQCFATGMLERLGIDGGLFAELKEPGSVLGPALLRPETTVYATASHDTASAVAAVPASAGEGWCYISSGTWSLMGVELPVPIINDAALQANVTNEQGVAGTIRFLKNIPGMWLLQECRKAWAGKGQEYSYAELTERARAAKPSGAVLDLDEFATPGDAPEQICDYCRRTGQPVPEDAGQVARVILQSLAVRYNQVLETLEKLTGRSIDVIHIVGGGSRNKLLNQWTADMTGRRVLAGPAEATAIGNALTQALGTGVIGSLDELRDVVRHSFEVEEFTPPSRLTGSKSPYHSE